MKERQVEILPCPFCGANPFRIAEKREVVNTETGEAISSNIGITYWKHPETPDCVLGFGMFFLDTPDDIQRWNSRTDKAKKQQSRRGAKMIHQNVDLYICEHCRLEFYDEEECLEHEKTHSPHFDGSTNEDIAKELDALGANACSFRVGDCVMGMTVHSFKNLMSVAARALRGGADNAGKE